MKKILPLLLLILLVSCSADVLDDSTGYITFSTDISRGVTAYIEWPSLLDRTWTVVATKTDTKGTEGQGTYTDILLTDSLGPFSVGSWTFTITDSDNLYTGTVNTTITPGSNSLNVTLHSTSNKGTLSIEDCSFLVSKLGTVNYVDCYVDDQRVNGTDWVVSPSMTTDNDYYVLPALSLQLSGGVHTVRLYYGTNSGGSSSDTVSVRVVNGMVTHLSIGEQEGNMLISVSFDIVEALV